MKIEDLRSESLQGLYENLNYVSATIEADANDALEKATSEDELIDLLLHAIDDLQDEVNGAVEIIKAGAKEINKEVKSLPRAKVACIKIRHEVDDNPDLSYLQRTASDHYGKKGSNWSHVTEEDKKKVIKEYGSIWDACIAYALKDKERLAAYNSGKWGMIGISARATILIPTDTVPTARKVQIISSGGLWGVESDSGKEYMDKVANEQVEELRHYLRTLNVEDADTCPVTEE